MSDPIREAAERYAKHKAVTEAEDSPYYIPSAGDLGLKWIDVMARDADIRTLAEAYLALGERHTEARFGVHNPTTGRLLQPFTTQSGAESFIKENRASACSVVRVVTFLSPVDTKGTT